MKCPTHIYQFPTFVKLKEGFDTEALLYYKLNTAFMYVATRKGWDMKKNGEQVYYINELGKWVPSRLLDIVNQLNPN